MWPFKRKSPPSPPPTSHIQPLNPAEEDWLHQQRDSLKTLSLAAGLPLPDPDHALEWADALVRWWHAEPPEARIHANILAYPIAIALGDALAAALDMQWALVTDATGVTNYGLCWSPAGAAPTTRARLTISPPQYIAQNFGRSPDGFLVSLYDAIVPETRRLQEQMMSAS